MAQNEIVNVLTIKTEDSQKTIKGLKKEISDLKKVLDNAVIGTEEFEQANRDLKVAQNELKAAMTGQKQTVEALDGSYDALVQEMAKLKKEWRATADVVKRDDLGKQIDNINDQLKELDATIGNNQRKVGAYAEEFGKALEKNNDSIAASATAFKQALNEQDDATISTRTKLESIQKVTAGLASGYAAVQGTMALLGIENENLEKTFVKLQAAMAIATGVGGMKDLVEGLSRGKVAFAGVTNGVKMFIKGLSGVQKAIIGTGIGALVVALGVLIANWDKIVGMFKKDQTEIKNVENSIKDLKEELKSSDEDFDFFIKLQQAAGKSREEILKLTADRKSEKFDKADLAYNAAVDSLSKFKMPLFGGKDDLDRLKAAVDEAKGIRDAAYREWQTAQNNITIYQKEQETKRIKDANDAAKERVNKQNAVLEEFRVSQLTEEEKLYDELDRKYQEYLKLFEGDTEKQLLVVQWYTDEYTKLVEKELDERINADAQIAKSAEETRKRIAEADKQRYATAVAESEKRLSKSFQTIDKKTEEDVYTTERRKPSGNGEINAIDNELSKLETLKKITNETLNLKVAAIDAEMALFEKSSLRWMELENQKVALREQTNRTLGELSEQYNEQEKNRNRVLAGSITNTFTTALSSASAIIGALQDGIDTTTKEGFERNKKMQIANATIQMLVGITSALAGAFTTKSGPWDIALAAIQAATIATTGGIQIANIKKQTFDGGGSSSTPSVTPTMGLSDNLPVSYTRNLMGDMETDTMNAAQRVYILESDIDESLRKVEVRDNNTNF